MFLPEQGSVHGGALGNRVVKSPKLAALVAPVAAAIEAVPVLGEFLGKQTNCYNSSVIRCDLASAMVGTSFQSSSRKDMRKVTLSCATE